MESLTGEVQSNQCDSAYNLVCKCWIGKTPKSAAISN